MKNFKIFVSSYHFGAKEQFDFGRITKHSYNEKPVNNMDELKMILNTEVHSFHHFPDISKEEASKGITSIRDGNRTERSEGIILDVDNQLDPGDTLEKFTELTLDEAKRILDREEISYVIYISKSHQMVKPKHEQDRKVDRFHILIPFKNPIVYKNIEGDKDNILKATFSHFDYLFRGRLDKACSDMARIIFPTRRDDFQMIAELDNRFFDWRKDIKYDVRDRFLNFATAPSEQPLERHETFRLNDVVKIGKSKHETTISQIKRKTTIYCPFHDDTTPSAFVDFNSEGIPYIHCSSCKSNGLGREGTYFLLPKDKEENRKKLEGLYAFQDSRSLKYFLYDSYGGLRIGNKQDIETHIYSKTGRKINRWNTHYVEYNYGEKFGLSDDGSIFNARKSMMALTEAITLVEKGMTFEEAQKNMPTISILLSHMFPQKEHLRYFMHFIAASLKRIKLPVAICLQDKGGTGKSFLMENILGETLFGIDEAFRVFHTDDLREIWTSWMEGKHLLFGDEIGIGKADRDRIEDNLKNLITSSTFRKREMRSDPTTGTNQFNIVIATNKNNPFHLVDTDRRWSFFTPGKTFEISKEERENGIRPWHLRANPAWKKLNIANPSEGRILAQAEAKYLAVCMLQIEPDLQLLQNVIRTDARKKMVEEQRDRFSEIAYRIYKRDVDWFQENVDFDNAKLNAMTGLAGKGNLRDILVQSLQNLTNDLRSGKDYVVVSDVYFVFHSINTDGHTTKKTLSTKLNNTGILNSLNQREAIQRGDKKTQERVYRIMKDAL